MRFAVSAPNFAMPGELVDLAVACERNGWDGFFLWDHVHREDNPPISDTWSTLAAAAVSTGRIRLGSWVTPIPRRRPHVVARQVTTVDHLSGGRAILGVGLGSGGSARALGELARFGEDPDPRRRRVLLDEGLEAIAGLFSGETFTLAGDLVTVEQATFLPRPVQRPGVPIWVACEWPHRRPLDRAVRYDGVAPIKIVDGVFQFMTPADVAELREEIDTRRRAAGADGPFDIAVVPGPPPHANPDEFEEAGATWVLAGSDGGPGWVEALTALIELGPAVCMSGDAGHSLD